MARKRLFVGLGGALAIVALAAANGCGSGKGSAGGGTATAARMSLLTKFDVNVKTGKVSITRLDSKGKAVLTGGAVSFTSSDLLFIPGDSGKRLVHVGVTNNSGEVTPISMRLVVGNVANNSIINYLTNTLVSLLAGSTSGYTDAMGASAQFNGPDGVGVGTASGTTALYVGDTSNNMIRKIQFDGNVTTLAGVTTSGSTDGTGTAAKFFAPHQVAVDSGGNVFVADFSNNRIRRITPLGEVTTIGGNGTFTSSDGTSGQDATFANPIGIAVTPSGSDIYVFDKATFVLRRLTWDGVKARSSALGYHVTTIAGSGAYGFADDIGNLAKFNNVSGVALVVDPSGDQTLYVADGGNGRIRRVTNLSATGATVSSVAGGGTLGTGADGPGSAVVFSGLEGITGIAVNNGSHVLFTTEDGTFQRIRAVIFTPGNEPDQKGNYYVATLAGSMTASALDGDGSTATFSGPFGIAAIQGTGPSATLYVADVNNHRIRKVIVNTGALHSGGTSPTGAPAELPRLVNWDSEVPHTTSTTLAWVKNIAPASDGPGYTADLQFHVPSGVSGFSFTAYVEADTNLVNLPANGAAFLSTLAGDGNQGFSDGPGKLAQFNFGSASVAYGVAAVPINVQSAYGMPAPIRAFIADTANNRIRYLDTNGNVGTFAGNGGTTFADGTGLAATFNGPRGIVVAPDGTLFVADTGFSRIRRISTAAVVNTIAGTGTAGDSDGTSGADATFNTPEGIAVDRNGNLFITDSLRNVARRVIFVGPTATAASSYKVLTIAGTAGTTTTFNGPTGIACDTDGAVYVADTANNRIRKLTRPAAPGAYSVADYITTGLSTPKGLAFDTAHNLYVADSGSHKILRVNIGGGTPVTIIGSTTGFTDSTLLTSSAPQLKSPGYVAVESSGNLLVTDANQAIRAVHRIVSDAQPTSP